ncbi:MAG TPA: type IX secretion system plug protein domain-containing protein [Bacteroidota bacterium]|nr:type IX secretion system plug protein domain-containing protein [Bacteroidota bacterium]
MKRFAILLSLIPILCFGQASPMQILGLRIYAAGDEYLPPVIAMGETVTIEFDVAAVHPPDLQIIFTHATRDWIPERNAFLTQEYHSKSAHLHYAVASAGVHHYSYHYRNSFPDALGIVRFPYSGNYLFTLVDKDSPSVALGDGRFVVVERAVGTTMRVENKLYTERIAPYNKMNEITVAVSIPSPDAQQAEGRILTTNVKSVDIYQNWKLYSPIRIDVDDNDPDTFVQGAYTASKSFVIRDVPPGNEYRRLDIGSPGLYPNGEPVRLREGADLSRFQWQGTIDANGAGKTRPFTGVNSDYLDVEFRLELPAPVKDEIYVVGAFNMWRLLDDFRMEPSDSLRGFYTLRHWIRRGVYDYQYVTAAVDSVTGDFINEDWLSLEGNDWRTINRYIAVVYCHDDRFGGFDRVVGAAVAKSPGGNDDSNTTASPR